MLGPCIIFLMAKEDCIKSEVVITCCLHLPGTDTLKNPEPSPGLLNTALEFPAQSAAQQGKSLPLLAGNSPLETSGYIPPLRYCRMFTGDSCQVAAIP
jgi:hypothetical protein